MSLKQQIYGMGKKVVDAGGSYIANHFMVEPGLDEMKGEQADAKREQIINNRNSRNADKARMGSFK